MAGDSLLDQTSALTQLFEHISSASHYTNRFIQYRKPIRDNKPSDEQYNCEFTMQEPLAHVKPLRQVQTTYI